MQTLYIYSRYNFPSVLQHITIWCLRDGDCRQISESDCFNISRVFRHCELNFVPTTDEVLFSFSLGYCCCFYSASIERCECLVVMLYNCVHVFEAHECFSPTYTWTYATYRDIGPLFCLG